MTINSSELKPFVTDQYYCLKQQRYNGDEDEIHTKEVLQLREDGIQRNSSTSSEFIAIS